MTQLFLSRLQRSHDYFHGALERSSPDECLTIEWSTTSGDFKLAIMAAVQEQLGLKDEPVKEPTDVLVIDHVDKLSENEQLCRINGSTRRASRRPRPSDPAT